MNCATHSETPASVYCRTCGKAMCDTCKRDVMGAIYCESCLAARLHGGGAATPGVAGPTAGDAQTAQAPDSNSLPRGAVVLIVLGVIFLLGNFGVFHLIRIEKFWPLLIIALGLWIAYQRTAPKA